MVVEKIGKIADGVYILGHRVAPVYLMDGVYPALFDGGMAFLAPHYHRHIRKILRDREPVYCFLTHSHWDHCGAVAYLKQQFPRMRVVGSQKVADVMAPGDHASTFAANPVVCAAANALFAKVSAPAFLEQVRSVGAYLGQRLTALAESNKAITEVRGRGMMWGVQANQAVAPVIQAGFDAGLLTCTAGPNVLRLLPPLTVTQADIDEAVSILEEAFGTLEV